MSQPKHRDVSIESYAVGFLLCLVLTVIPGYLVTNESFVGDRLLAIIMGFAVLQVIVQIVFFLHLGRGPKPFYNIVFFGATVGIILIVAGGSLFIMSHLHYNMTPEESAKQLAESEGIYQVEGSETGACQTIGQNHQVVINGGVANPTTVSAKVCDTLTFVNRDDVARELTFATHPDQGAYAGESELALRKGRGETITLNQVGSFEFHDHLHPEASGFFTVAQ